MELQTILTHRRRITVKEYLLLGVCIAMSLLILLGWVNQEYLVELEKRLALWALLPMVFGFGIILGIDFSIRDSMETIDQALVRGVEKSLHLLLRKAHDHSFHDDPHFSQFFEEIDALLAANRGESPSG